MKKYKFDKAVSDFERSRSALPEREVEAMIKKQLLEGIADNISIGQEYAIRISKREEPDKTTVYEISVDERDCPEVSAELTVAPSEAISGYQAGKTTGDVTRLLNYLSEGTCKGIKSATVYRIRKFAEEMGLI